MGALDVQLMRAIDRGENSAARVIAQDGTPETVWDAWPGLDAVELIPIEKWMHPMARLVVVAPHPDDEILACGGLMALHARRGGKCVVVAVTDGEASHGEDHRWRAGQLGETRRAERACGLAQLGCAQAEVHRLGLPDSKVASHLETLQSELAKRMQWGDIVVTTWRHDGHPDHEVCGAAAAKACADVRCRLLQAPSVNRSQARKYSVRLASRSSMVWPSTGACVSPRGCNWLACACTARCLRETASPGNCSPTMRCQGTR